MKTKEKKTEKIAGKTKNTAKKTSTKKSKDKKVDEENIKNVEKKITDKKDLLYIYPQNCDTLPERKKFRHSVRRKVRAFEKKIAKAQDKKEKEALLKKARAFGNKVYTKGNNPF
jgi:endo-alpha-1,4-polygalactosaminidase (GH114 family)